MDHRRSARAPRRRRPPRDLWFLCASADASPLRRGEHVFSRRGKLIGDMALTRPPASGDREHEPDVARVDFLQLPGFDPAPLEAARIEPLTERRGKAKTCIRQHRCKPNVSGADAIDLGQRDLWLCTRCAPILGARGPCAIRSAASVSSPAKQAQADHYQDLVPRQRQRHQRLAIGGLAERRGVLRSPRRPNATPSSAVPCRRR